MRVSTFSSKRIYQAFTPSPPLKLFINLKQLNCLISSPQNAVINSQNLALLCSYYDLHSPLGFQETTDSWLSSPAGCFFPVSWAGSSLSFILSVGVPPNQPAHLLSIYSKRLYLILWLDLPIVSRCVSLPWTSFWNTRFTFPGAYLTSLLRAEIPIQGLA